MLEILILNKVSIAQKSKLERKSKHCCSFCSIFLIKINPGNLEVEKNFKTSVNVTF